MTTNLSSFAAQVQKAFAVLPRLTALPLRPNFIAAPMAVGILLCFAQPAPAQFTGQGPMLSVTGAGAVLKAGTSVALSADGNTALVGMPGSNSNSGGVWVFTRSAGVWTHQAQVFSPDPAAQFGSGAGNVGTTWQVLNLNSN